MLTFALDGGIKVGGEEIDFERAICRGESSQVSSSVESESVALSEVSSVSEDGCMSSGCSIGRFEIGTGKQSESQS